MELRLAEKEEKLLEKDLIFEEVNRLSERTEKKAETGKEDTLSLAKKVIAHLIIVLINYSTASVSFSLVVICEKVRIKNFRPN